MEMIGALILVAFGFGLVFVFIYLHKAISQQEAKRREEEREERKKIRRERADKRDYQNAIDFAEAYPQGLIFPTKEEIPAAWKQSRYLTITYALDKDSRVIGYKIIKNFQKPLDI